MSVGFGGYTIVKKKNRNKVDILIKHVDDDFGGGTVSTKNVTEAGLKLPKSLKDVIWNLLKKPTEDIQSFIIHGAELTVKLMDVPSGNICRLYTLGSMPFPRTPETFYKDFIPLVTLVWQCKTLLKETLGALNTDNSVFIPTIDDPVPTSKIPYCIPSPKKRKISDAGIE
ncbi:hypothetical protein BDC45DRAFT_184200 [Circinella umbellata]|nr:hypothetical protein BDC45DRAFT_184200 [Circinella umbellata]